MDLDINSLYQSLARAPLPFQKNANFAPQVTFERPSQFTKSVSLSDLATMLNNWGAVVTAAEPEADDKLRAAYLMGNLAWSIMAAISKLAFGGAWVTNLRADAIALSVRFVDWDIDGKSGTKAVFDVVLDPRAITAKPYHDSTVTREMIITLFKSPVELMAAKWGLGVAALWRLVGDAFSAMLLLFGKCSDRVSEATDIARAVLHHKGTPLYSKETKFITITLPDKPEIFEVFRVRGGCCRNYTMPGGDYCTTCVLRDNESRQERLIAHLLSESQS